jgi:hypothetical protein
LMIYADMTAGVLFKNDGIKFESCSFTLSRIKLRQARQVSQASRQA